MLYIVIASDLDFRLTTFLVFLGFNLTFFDLDQFTVYFNTTEMYMEAIVNPSYVS